MGDDELVAECRLNMTVKALRGSFIVYQHRNDSDEGAPCTRLGRAMHERIKLKR